MHIRALRALLLVAAAASAHAQTYSAFDDFDTATNPSSFWSYGQTNTLGGTFTVLSTPLNFTGDMFGWGTGGTFPFVMKNETGGIVTSGTTLYQPGLLALHPDNAGNFAVLRWTAPASGSYLITGVFADVPNDAAATADVHVRLNGGSSLFSAGLNGGTTTASYTSSPLGLTLGDTVDFVVGSGGNGYTNDHTALTALVLAVVPEPGTAPLLLGAAAILGVLTRRRRG